MNIYVGNLSYGTTEDDLVSLFSGVGSVDSARIISDRETGRSKGFGFVEMGDSNEGKAAIEKFNGTELDNRNITVNEAKPREEGGNRGGFGGGRGGNSRGGFGGGRGRY
ncbi:RNA-binding protein [Seleniivibrio woodruffii]|uniref:RNA recognition motif domain-containing protein n=1 Tax=Seleniivibrio woodruffii TaxID=1078050 RepID=UPI0026EB7255|nr:RNA-binding protein [Seleniivibrio woodruffii]